MDVPRLLFVHAHPDDETLTTGATIAHYAARGADVRVLTCTLGEEGEVIGPRWAGLAAQHADQLGGYRIGELSAALRELGVGPARFLGHAGRWRDSGMAGSPPGPKPRFADAGPDAVDALVEVLREFRPHVVVTYDPDGGYGHPDHVRAHVVTMAAIGAAAEPPGDTWQVPKTYWTVLNGTALTEALDELGGLHLPAGWTVPEPGYFEFVRNDGEIDAVIEAPGCRAAKVAALRAHATQVEVDAGGRACALSNGIALPIGAAEHYVLAAGAAGPRDERGWETDLFAGLEVELPGLAAPPAARRR